MKKTLSIFLLCAAALLCASCGHYIASRILGTNGRSPENLTLQDVSCSFIPANKKTFPAKEPFQLNVKFTASCISLFQQDQTYEMEVCFSDSNNQSVKAIKHNFHSKDVVNDVLSVHLKSLEEMGLRQGEYSVNVWGYIKKFSPEFQQIQYCGNRLMFSVSRN